LDADGANDHISWPSEAWCLITAQQSNTILGYVCQFPAHKPITKKGMNIGFVAPTMAADVANGSAISCGPLKSVSNVS
jgi:hypothetical protein